MKSTATRALAICLLSILSRPTNVVAADRPATDGGYAVVVSETTYDDAAWKRVVDALVEKHEAEVLVHEESIDESLDKLQASFPRYVCFVATPAEATRQFVADVHQLTRKLDDDPYTDAIWGILTGYDADGALRIARQTEPLVVRRVASGTEVELAMCEEGVWHCELVKGRMVRKLPGEKPELLEGPADSTKALVDLLNEYRADLMVTSGHATERDWQIGFRYRNGQFRCKDGGLYGLDTQGKRHPIDSPNPKVYLPIGNCLMGHINGPDVMALAWLNSAGVCQMLGYTVPTWYGYAGWGCLDYFVEQPGRYTFAEAVFANQQALLHRLETYFPEAASSQPAAGSRARPSVALSEEARRAGLTSHDARGLLFDRDVLAFYGDPAWVAKMAPGPLAWEQKLEVDGDEYRFEIVPKRGAKTFEPININGSQRGGRPIVQWLPHRVADVKIAEGAELKPLVADNFILVPNPGQCDPDKRYKIVFRATKL